MRIPNIGLHKLNWKIMTRWQDRNYIKHPRVESTPSFDQMICQTLNEIDTRSYTAM